MMNQTVFTLPDGTEIEVCRSQSHPDVKGGQQTNEVPPLWCRVNGGDWEMAPHTAQLLLALEIAACDTREEFEVLVMEKDP